MPLPVPSLPILLTDCQSEGQGDIIPNMFSDSCQILLSVLIVYVDARSPKHS